MPEKCDKLRLDVERKSVQRHPALDADADGRDLVLESVALVRPPHPHADAVVAPLAAHVEGGQRADDPFLDGGDEAAHVRRAALEIEHDIADPLAGAVIGELAAAARAVNREARFDQLLRLRRGAGGVKRRMLNEPDQLARFAARDCFARASPWRQALRRSRRGRRSRAIRPAARRLAAKARSSGRRAC